MIAISMVFIIAKISLRGDAWLEATNFPRQLWDLTSEELQLLRDEGRVQKQALLGQKKFGFKGKRCWLEIWKVDFFHGWGGRRMWYVKNLNNKPYVVPSGTVTKEEIHIRRAKGQNKRAINTKNVKHQIPWRVFSRLSSKALPRECIGSSHQLPFVRNHKLVSGSTDFSHFANYSITTQGIPHLFLNASR